MSERGRSDKFRSHGTRTEDRDATRAAHQRVAQSEHAAKQGIGRRVAQGGIEIAAPLAEFVRAQATRRRKEPKPKPPLRRAARVEPGQHAAPATSPPPTEMYGETHAFREGPRHPPAWSLPSAGEAVWLAAKGGARLGAWLARKAMGLALQGIERAVDERVARLARRSPTQHA